jgi:hypothetical protein
VATAPKPKPRKLSAANATPLGPPKAPIVASVRCQVAQGATEDGRNVEVVTGTPTDCPDDVFESNSAENLPSLVTSPVDSDEEADIVTQDRNVASMNGHLVVSLKEQLGEVAAEKHLLEQQLEETRASLAQQASRPEPGVGTGFRLVPTTTLWQAENYAVALVRRCGMHAAMCAVTMEEIGRHMFIRHMEREFVKSLDCNCVSRAYRHIESKGVNMQPHC